MTDLDPVKDFYDSRLQNMWLTLPCMQVYVRKATHLHPLTKEPLWCFDIANIHVNEANRCSGTFTAWLNGVIVFAAERGFDAIHIENVLTDRFANYFRRDCRWIETSHAIPSFFHIFPKEST